MQAAFSKVMLYLFITCCQQSKTILSHCVPLQLKCFKKRRKQAVKQFKIQMKFLLLFHKYVYALSVVNYISHVKFHTTLTYYNILCLWFSHKLAYKKWFIVKPEKMCKSKISFVSQICISQLQKCAKFCKVIIIICS